MDVELVSALKRTILNFRLKEGGDKNADYM